MPNFILLRFGLFLNQLRMRLWLYLPVAMVLVGAMAAFPLGYLKSAHSVIGFCVFPFAFFISGKSRFNHYYFLAIIFFGFSAQYYQVKVFYFFSLAFFIFFYVELLFGKLNTVVVFLLAFMSPVFLQLTTIIGFSFRLFLSEWAGAILRWFGLPIIVQGNLIKINGFDFAVDEACMGLHMLVISMLGGVIILVNQYRSGKRLALGETCIFFLIVFVFTLFSNLLRIIVLVLFRVLPENPMHEIIGLLCMAGYVLIPTYYLSRRMVNRFGNEAEERILQTRLIRSKQWLISCIAFTLLIIGLTFDSYKSESKLGHVKVETHSMKEEKLAGGITKLVSNELLVYIKPIPEFFTGEHTPLMCWKGSGYDFKSIQKQRVEEREIYTGLLARNQEILHTAWWYSDGEMETIDQFTWRGRMLTNNRKFCLVNVTAPTEALLQQTVIAMMGKRFDFKFQP